MPAVGAVAAPEQVEGVVEAFGEVGEVDGAETGGRELDGEREAIEPLAQRLDLRPVEDDPGIDRLGALAEQVDGVVQLDRPDRDDRLGGDGQALPAGGQHVGARDLGHDRREGGGALEQVLAVVEHEEPGRRRQVAGDRVGRVVGRLVHRQPLGDRPGDGVRTRIGGQTREVDEERRAVGGDVDRQAGLAGTAGADEGHQRVVGDGVDDQGELARTTDERRGDVRQR